MLEPVTDLTRIPAVPAKAVILVQKAGLGRHMLYSNDLARITYIRNLRYQRSYFQNKSDFTGIKSDSPRFKRFNLNHYDKYQIITTNTITFLITVLQL